MSAGLAVGAFVFYLTRAAMGRTRIAIGGEELAHTPSRPQRRRARND